MNIHKTAHAVHPRRGGAVIIVVISLLTTLVFLGLFFFNWSSQEVANAELFADPDDEGAAALDADLYLDMAAEQLIVGTRSAYSLSALWGGMHSMLAHEIGRINPDLTATDTNVASGNGIMTQYVDSNGDGYPDLNNAGNFDDPDSFHFIYQEPGQSPLSLNIDSFILNYGPMAQSDRSVDAFSQTTNPIPNYRPDVDYTYPDVNSLFLAHDELATDPTDASNRKLRIQIPSFFRPQLFPAFRSNDGSGSFQSLYTNATYKAKVFRPHQSHLYSNGDQRYLTTSTTAASGDVTRLLPAFPFPANTADAQMGVFNNVTNDAAGANYTLLDKDLDGDGIKDSIWIDLNLPLINLPGGDQVVPVASFKVIDADGLLNLNAVGNLEGANRLGRDQNSNEPISLSNLGMSRSEVNPLWALDGDVSSLTGSTHTQALQVAADRFGFDPASANPSRLSLASMEWFLLLTGWKPTTGEQSVEGRFGENEVLDAGNIPMPGQLSADDDSDNSSNGGFSQQKVGDADVGGLTVPSFLHPLAPTGLGIRGFTTTDTTSPSYLTADSTGGRRVLSYPLTNNPAGWLQYQNFLIPLASQYPPALMPAAVTNQLMDEADETILETGSSQYGLYDSPFSPSENAGLHLSESDLLNSSVASRSRTLAAANFQHVTDADQIRRRFTTDSWDRLEFNFSAPTFRTWEWGTSQRFPPQFTVSTGVQPFRPEMRDLFRTDYVSTNPLGSNRVSPRHRLNLNRILSNDKLAGGTNEAFVDSSPRYRNLVPHPQTLTGGTPSLAETAMYHGEGAPSVSFTAIASDVCAQEWWARYDRQRLARDIYCLLWVLGSGADTNFLTTNPYTAVQAREMAQFAVNVVDAMDRDHIITAFEYDANLTDGWDTTSTNLEVVYGIEHQELAFNEVFFIRTEHQTSDVNITEYDESDTNPHYHSFIELRNAAPWKVDISDSSWRIRRIDTSSPPNTLFTATLKDNTTQYIDLGGEYLIGCQDGTNLFSGGAESGQLRPSDFRVDTTGTPDGTFELVVPNYLETSPPTNNQARTPMCDLDLMYAAHHGRVKETVSGTYTSVTSLLNDTNKPTGSPQNVRLVLERRLRPDSGESLSDAANPWVEVDRIEGTIRSFNSTVARLSGSDFKSQERRGPYDGGSDITYATLTPQDYDGTASGTQGQHTLPYLNQAAKGSGIRRNNRAPSQYTIWQPHFDRDYSSVMELLTVPLYGNFVQGSGDPWSGTITGGATRNVALPGGTLSMVGQRTAASRMLNPQGPSDTNFPLPSWMPDFTDNAIHYQNRWYRLLEFVEVKSQDQLRIDPLIAIDRRTPGKVNLNTLRHESVFAGLVDDPFQLDPRNHNAMTVDRIEGTSRRWYGEHRYFRDGLDKFMENASLPYIAIPGGFKSRPFRSLSYLDRPIPALTSSSNLSVQSTILRQRGAITSGELINNMGHSLYEARSSADTMSSSPVVDYHTKNRLLGKVANNSTTRSHVFMAWVGIDFFQAHQNANGNVQLGGVADDLPSYRMFVVVDMSRLEEAYDSTSGTFDFRKFIIHRQLLP